MKFAIKALIAAAAVLCACADPASASYDLYGLIPPASPPKPVVLHLPSISKGYILLIFYAPPTNVGVDYTIDFCIGPAFNPCGLPTATVVTVPKGQSRSLVVDSSIFDHDIFVVEQATSKPVPYEVNVTVIVP